MKKLFFTIICAAMSQLSIAQNASEEATTKDGIIESSFKVDGVCGMCEERIENAALRTKGVKLADWDKESKILKVTYKSSKVSEDEIHAAVAGVGHDTEKQKAEDQAYEKVHPCCRYRDEEVLDNHKK